MTKKEKEKQKQEIDDLLPDSVKYPNPLESRPYRPPGPTRGERLEALRNYQRHPVTRALKYAGLGQLPDEKKLDELGLPATARRKVSDTAKLVVATFASGEQGRARSDAEEAAGQIFDSLPEELRDSSYWDEPEPDITDPADLAAQVSKGW